jgi:HEAT repeats
MVPRLARRTLVRLGIVAALILGAAPSSVAQDDSGAFRDLAIGTDFRLRVAAALTLGKSKSAGARPALEKALGDPNPAVRAAAAAGLGAVGDPAAIVALKSALTHETTPNVKAQLETTIKRLGSGPATKANTSKPKFLIALGRLENRSGSGTAEVVTALKAATRVKMAAVPGIEILDDGSDIAAASKSRNLPAFTVDGSLTELAKKQSRTGVSFSARVEYLIRKMPEQSLKGTMSGNAQAQADSKEIHGQNELSQLQIDAVGAAIDSALKGASPALEAAAR